MDSLGSRRAHRNPQYFMDKMARVKSAADFRSKARIDVQFLDHGKCMPVWVVGDVDREPVEGDMVIIGYMEGRKDAPYLKSFVRNDSYTANYIEVGKDYIRLQLPLTKEDRDKNMLDDTKKNTRVYLELNGSGASIYHSTGDVFLVSGQHSNVKLLAADGDVNYTTLTRSGSLTDLHKRIEALEARPY